MQFDRRDFLKVAGLAAVNVIAGNTDTIASPADPNQKEKTSAAPQPASLSKNRAQWMADGMYGLGIHWTSQSLPKNGDKPKDFQEAVNDFDMDLFIRQVVESGAAYVLFTISHARQFLPFPSQIMDKVLAGRTCKRDLMQEMADALEKHRVKMLFYYPSVADDVDPDWQKASRWLSDPAGWANLQYDLTAEIGQRYGKQLAGWWIDNCYDKKLNPSHGHHLHSSLGGFSDLYDFSRYAAALRTGNDGRVVTFNFTGTGTWKSKLGISISDYAAGESNDLDRVPSGPLSGEGGSQWHSFVWMDDCWVHAKLGQVAEPRLTDEHVIDYIKYVGRYGGVFTYNAAPYQDKLIAEATMMQLRRIKKTLRSEGTGNAI